MLASSEATEMDSVNELFSLSLQKPFKCFYDGCSKEYTNEVHLRRHIRTSHEEKTVLGAFTCSFPGCGQEFTNSSNMKRHFKVKHVQTPKFSCSECAKTYFRKNQLNKHLKSVHAIGDFKYFCIDCAKGFFNRQAHSKHLKSHLKKEDLRQCENCELSFKNWSDLVRHRREAHKIVQIGRFYCDLCPRVFNWKKSLRFHMKSHLKQEVEFFHCPHQNCSKFYSTKSNLTAHIRSKHEGMTYLCSICNINISTKQRFKQHMDRHVDPNTEIKESCLSLLVGLKMEEITNGCVNFGPKMAEVPTESELSE